MCEGCVRWCEAVAGTPGDHERECPACGANCRMRVPQHRAEFPWSELLFAAMVLGVVAVLSAAHLLGGK